MFTWPCQLLCFVIIKPPATSPTIRSSTKKLNTLKWIASLSVKEYSHGRLSHCPLHLQCKSPIFSPKDWELNSCGSYLTSWALVIYMLQLEGEYWNSKYIPILSIYNSYNHIDCLDPCLIRYLVSLFTHMFFVFMLAFTLYCKHRNIRPTLIHWFWYSDGLPTVFLF